MAKDLHKKLSNLLGFFINRPNHLAKYLLDSNALSSDFLRKIQNVDLPDVEKSKMCEIYFVDIKQMNNFYSNLLSKDKYPDLNTEDLSVELIKELEKCINEERYEDAIRIRDYLKNLKNNDK